jgi:hypothetical protein
MVTFPKLTAKPKARASPTTLSPPWRPIVGGIFIGMRGQASDMGRRRFWRFSGAQSGSAVRSVGDLPESAPTTLTKDYLFESALVSLSLIGHKVDQTFGARVFRFGIPIKVNPYGNRV